MTSGPHANGTDTACLTFVLHDASHDLHKTVGIASDETVNVKLRDNRKLCRTSSEQMTCAQPLLKA